MFRRRPVSIAIGLAIIIASITFSRTLAGSISLGSGNAEFGQGVLLVTNCDSTIYAQPSSESTGTPGQYRLKGFSFWGIDTSACNQVDFKVRIFDTSTALSFFGTSPSAVDEVTIRLISNYFYAVTDGVTIYPGDELGYFAFDLDDPTPSVNAFDLKKVTLESVKAGTFAPCSPTVYSANIETVYTFETLGACTFTSPVTRPATGKNAATLEVIGGAGGGAGGAIGEVLTNSNVSLTANAKYVILVGAGGAVGKPGRVSAGFGVRAQPGAAGEVSGSPGSNGRVELRYET